MKNYKAYFSGKKITVMGLGLLGRGVGDVEFLAKQEAFLTVTDLKTEPELKESLDKLKNLKNIKFVLGGHKLEDFKDCHMILKAAGVPLDSPFVAEARRNKIPVEMSSSLFAKLSPAVIVGVTGTRGKSTVAAMVFEILKTADRKVFLGGNLRGVSTLAHLPESSSDEIAVLELDSWQLQGFGEAKLSPHVSIFTTFYPDHLNYYGGDLGRYLEDKSFIFRFQKDDDYLILGSQCQELVRKKYPQIKSKITVSHYKDISFDLKILGEHNRYNAALAKAAAQVLGVDKKITEQPLANFKAVPGRLEFIREVNGIEIYNDTTATTPQATIAALEALNEPKAQSHKQNPKIILIIGGADKGLDLRELLQAVSKFCKVVILLPGTGTEKLTYNLQPTTYNLVESNNLQEALQKAMALAQRGDLVLFSPAFASFGPPPGGFKNEFERGDKFNEIVKNL